MIIKRDFHFSKDVIIDYYYQLKSFIGKKISQRDIASNLEEVNTGKTHFNSFDRKFVTLKFYGFVYFDKNGIFRFNENYEKYVFLLENNRESSKSFIDIIRTSRYEYYPGIKVNFFELIINLLLDNDIIYLDHFDIISYIIHYDRINDYSKLKSLILKNRALSFDKKVTELERFYEFQLGKIAVNAHDSKYLFTFLVNNGFHKEVKSQRKKDYYQGNTKRTVDDIRLYISTPITDILNGFDIESITDEIEYNSTSPIEKYDETYDNDTLLIDQSTDFDKTISKRYKTDRKLRSNALFNANFSCELAFLKKEIHKTFSSNVHNYDYAEVHHLVPMHAQEDDLFVRSNKLVSLDQISNLIVLCPLCHARLHYGIKKEVERDLELLFDYKKDALKRNGIELTKKQLLEFYSISS